MISRDNAVLFAFTNDCDYLMILQYSTRSSKRLNSNTHFEILNPHNFEKIGLNEIQNQLSNVLAFDPMSVDDRIDHDPGHGWSRRHSSSLKAMVYFLCMYDSPRILHMIVPLFLHNSNFE